MIFNGYATGWEAGDLPAGTLVARSAERPEGVGGGPLDPCEPWDGAVVHVWAEQRVDYRTEYVATLCRSRTCVRALVPVRAAAATCKPCLHLSRSRAAS